MSTKREAAHTPGPWTIDPSTCPNDILGGDNVQELLASAYPMKHDGLHNSWKANARLIAAAPDLLLELEHELEELDGWLRDEWTQDDIKDSMLIRKRIIAAVIKKARGE